MAQARDTAGRSAPSRRALLAGGAAVLLAPAAPSRAIPDAGQADPVLVLWQEWQRLDAEAETRRRAWQNVETLLFRIADLRKARAAMPGDGSAPTIDGKSIDALLGTASETQALRAQLHAGLAARRPRWPKAAARHLADLEQQYAAADDKADAASARLFGAPAASLAGVAAKLTLVLELGQPAPREQGFPWPQLRSALADLQRLACVPGLLP